MKRRLGGSSSAIGALALAGSVSAGTVESDIRATTESLVIEIGRLVGLHHDATPTAAPLDGTEVVFVEPLVLHGGDLEITWTLDGRVVERSDTSLDLRALRVAPGTHKLAVILRDPTDLVRDEIARERWLTDALTWTLVVPAEPADLDRDGDVDVDDLERLLDGWDTNPGGPPDFDGDGRVANPDLMHLLDRWSVP